jgi:MFS family permease
MATNRGAIAVATGSGGPAVGSVSETRVVFVAAWVLALVFYFLQYSFRSAPGVMIPELRDAFRLTPMGITSVLGLYYYSYAFFAIVAGASLDRYGGKLPIGFGVSAVAVGCVLFGSGTITGAEWGRFLQGAGSGFAFPGAVYLATHAFSARWLATAIGFTQLAGMLGGFAGQFVVGPLVHGEMNWQAFWLHASAVSALLGAIVLALLPGAEQRATTSIWSMFAPYKTVLTNPQSYLCGLVSGLMFMPTTIGNMVWGVPFRHDGLGFTMAEAVERSSMLPLGWVIGAPLPGYVADRLGRRKPVVMAGIAIMLVYFLAIIFVPYDIPSFGGGLLFGIGSGAAMIPYTMIKEVNPDRVKGSAAGAMNFLVFSLSAVLGPMFGLVLVRLSGGHELTLATFLHADWAGVGAIVLAFVLTLFLRETGSAASAPKPVASATD